MAPTHTLNPRFSAYSEKHSGISISIIIGVIVGVVLLKALLCLAIMQWRAIKMRRLLASSAAARIQFETAAQTPWPPAGVVAADANAETKLEVEGVTDAPGDDNARQQHTSLEEPPEYVIAMYDFTAESESELSFYEGSCIRVLERDDGWWKGELRGQIGYFPSNFCEIKSVEELQVIWEGLEVKKAEMEKEQAEAERLKAEAEAEEAKGSEKDQVAEPAQADVMKAEIETEKADSQVGMPEIVEVKTDTTAMDLEGY